MGAVFPPNIVMRVSSICKGRLAYLRLRNLETIQILIYVDQASVVRRSDNTIHWINLYLVNNVLLSLIRWIATQNEFSFLLPNPLLLYMLLVTMCHLDNEQTFNGKVSVRRGLLLRSTSVVSLQLPLKFSLNMQFQYLLLYQVKIINRRPIISWIAIITLEVLVSITILGKNHQQTPNYFMDRNH